MDIAQGFVYNNKPADDDESPPETFMGEVNDRNRHQFRLFFNQAGYGVVKCLDAGDGNFIRVADDGYFPFALFGKDQRVQYLGIGPPLIGVIGIDGPQLLGNFLGKFGLQFGFVFSYR